MREAVYGPEEEGILALPGYNFGLDVVARIGELRYRANLSILKIEAQLRAESKSNLQISIKEVELLCEVYLALVTTVASQDQMLMEELRKSGGIVLSIDGIQPEKSNETLYILSVAERFLNLTNSKKCYPCSLEVSDGEHKVNSAQRRGSKASNRDGRDNPSGYSE